MLPKIQEENLLHEITQARHTGDTKPLLAILPIWMVYKLSKKRKIDEDQSSEMLVLYLEVFAKMWNLSLNYSIEQVLGFFVTYGFNQFRNHYRKSPTLEKRELFLQLWSKQEEDPTDTWILEPSADLLREIYKFPKLSLLVFSLRFDLPLPPTAHQFLLWKLRERNLDPQILVECMEERRSKIQKRETHFRSIILKYTRLLFEEENPQKRIRNGNQKKLWIVKRKRAQSRGFFSEREIARWLGLSRKAVRTILDRGRALLSKDYHEFLHVA